MWVNTDVTAQLNITYPIIQAGMAGSTTPELVAAVSEAGGLGTIGAGYMSPDALKSDIRAVQRQTTAPFAVNLFVPEKVTVSDDDVAQMQAWLKPYRDAFDLQAPAVDLASNAFHEQLDVVIETGIRIVSFTFGVPEPDVCARLKAHGVVCIGTATSVVEAIVNEAAGMDMVVAQGSEAGGHRGCFLEDTPSIGTLSLVPQCADAVDIPVIAAGGIADGRGLVAGLALGADAVQVGTAFLTTDESGAHDAHKSAILNALETDTVLTRAFSGKSARGIRNAFIETMATYPGAIPPYPVQNQLTSSIRKAAAQNNKTAWMHMWCGQSPRLTVQQRAHDVIAKMVADASHMLSK